MEKVVAKIKGSNIHFSVNPKCRWDAVCYGLSGRHANQTLQIISLREQLGYEEELCVKTVGEMPNIMASAENELILQTGSGTFRL